MPAVSVSHRWARAAGALLFGAAGFVACIDSSGLSDAKCLAVCQGVCVDTQRDDANCGACGNVCAAGQSCGGGVCGGCPPGVDTKSDTQNCGACGKVCPPGIECSDGTCRCPPATPEACGTGANTTCTDVQRDAANCGGCGKRCEAGQACAAGKCLASLASSAHALLAGQVGSWGTLDGTGTAARFNQPWSVCNSGADLYVADSNNCVIRKVVMSTGATSTFAGFIGSCVSTDGVGAGARFSSPGACAMDGKGNMFLTERGCLVRKVELATARVTTIAGLNCGYADGTGPAASFNGPQGIAYDGSAKLYIGDTSNHAIRKLDIASGAVTTLAGAAPPTAQPGNTDETGNAARFNNPQALYVDAPAGVLYVTDFSNHTLRRVALTDGKVVTVVGAPGEAGATDGTGTAARLRNPFGLAFDGKDKLYVSEDGNHDIRVVSLPAFTVLTNAGAAGVAGYADGSGTGALFYNPRGLTFDGAGNYYVADLSNNAIRKVVAASGAVTTLAGLGAAFGSSDGPGPAATFNYPFGLAFDGTDTIYVSDYTASTIRSISLSKGTVATVAGTANATGNVDGTGAAVRFSSPAGLALDGGNLYVADRGNHTIRKVVVASGAVTTLAGSPGNPGYQEGTGASARFSQPFALAFDAGKLYVTELENRVVRVVPVTGGSTTTLAGAPPENVVRDGIGTSARFSSPTGVAVKDAKVYVADANRLRVVDLATGSVVTVSGGGGYSDGTGAYANFNFNGQPGFLSFDSQGDLLIADYNNGLLRKFSPTTMTTTTVAGLNGIFGARLGPMPTSIATSPRAVIAIPNGGIAFSASYGVFTIR